MFKYWHVPTKCGRAKTGTSQIWSFQNWHVLYMVVPILARPKCGRSNTGPSQMWWCQYWPVPIGSFQYRHVINMVVPILAPPDTDIVGIRPKYRHDIKWGFEPNYQSIPHTSGPLLHAPVSIYFDINHLHDCVLYYLYIWRMIRCNTRLFEDIVTEPSAKHYLFIYFTLFIISSHYLNEMTIYSSYV